MTSRPVSPCHSCRVPLTHSNESDSDLLEGSYCELHDLAERMLRFERRGHTLQPTALVHEVYCRVIGQACEVDWRGRDHFMAVAAEVMRRVLVDHARKRLCAKRGGGLHRLPADDTFVGWPISPAEILEVHEALEQLAKADPLAAELVKMRFFAGLSHADAAAVLGITKSKADRVWAYAKARLYLFITGQSVADPKPCLIAD